MDEIAALTERIEELEIAYKRLLSIIENDKSAFYGDAFLQKNINKVRNERENANKRLQQLRSKK
jgi:hypothetical protein